MPPDPVEAVPGPPRLIDKLIDDMRGEADREAAERDKHPLF